MLKIETLAVTRCSIDLLLHQVAVLRMNSREDKFRRRLRGSIALKDSVGLFGPENLSARNVPAEAACLSESLGLGQLLPPSAHRACPTLWPVSRRPLRLPPRARRRISHRLSSSTVSLVRCRLRNPSRLLPFHEQDGLSGVSSHRRDFVKRRNYVLRHIAKAILDEGASKAALDDPQAVRGFHVLLGFHRMPPFRATKLAQHVDHLGVACSASNQNNHRT